MSLHFLRAVVPVYFCRVWYVYIKLCVWTSGLGSFPVFLLLVRLPFSISLVEFTVPARGQSLCLKELCLLKSHGCFSPVASKTVTLLFTVTHPLDCLMSTLWTARSACTGNTLEFYSLEMCHRMWSWWACSLRRFIISISHGCYCGKFAIPFLTELILYFSDPFSYCH